MRIRFLAVAGFLLVVVSAYALDSDGGPKVSLVPQPKEVHFRDGGFRVSPKTKIVVQLGHQSEDRIAAETLAEEIADQSGFQLNIVGMKAASKAEGGAIVLARLQDAHLRRFLTDKGLNVDRSIGEQGYLLFADKSHLIVAANTGQGLFYGVQTLRQLLHANGKELTFPALTIRDWPNLEPPSTQQDLSQGTVPELVKGQRVPQS